MLKFENHEPLSYYSKKKTYEAEKESVLMEIIKDFIDDESDLKGVRFQNVAPAA